jgi:hypothetical protein
VYSAPSETVDRRFGAAAVYTPDCPFQFTVALVVSPALKPGAMQNAMDVLIPTKPRPFVVVLTGRFCSNAVACSTKQNPSVAPCVGDPGAEAVNLNETDVLYDAQKEKPLYQIPAYCRPLEKDD